MLVLLGLVFDIVIGVILLTFFILGLVFKILFFPKFIISSAVILAFLTALIALI